jgi:hypothetical protein
MQELTEVEQGYIQFSDIQRRGSLPRSGEPCQK